MKYTLAFELSGLPKMANQLLRGHWRAKHAHTKKWKQAVAAKITEANKPRSPLVSAALSFTRVSSVEPDFDGLVSSFKAVQDSLVECGVLASDKSSCIGQPKYFWEKCKPKSGHIRIVVEEI